MRSRSVLVVALGLVFTAGYSLASTVSDLCTGDPCTVTSAKTVTPNSNLDFGARALVLSANGKITVSPAGALTITAGNVHLGAGRTIVDKGGAVTITTTNDLQLDTGAAIDTALSDASSANVVLHAGGQLVLNGGVDASSTGANNSGGTIAADASSITVGATIAAQGGSGESSGGTVTLVSRTFLAVNATIDVSGGDYDGGTIELDADTNVAIAATGKLDARATSGSGFGGTIAVTATGTIDVHGPIVGQGSSAGIDGGGDGAEVDLVAGDLVVVAAPITASGAAPDGYGGNIDIEAGTDIVQTALIDAKANGGDGSGSTTFAMFAGRDITTGPIDVSGGSTGGGSVDIAAVHSVTIAAVINADANAPDNSGQGGDVTIAADVVTLSATADVHANGDFVGGNVNLQGCSVTAAAGSNISSGGDQGGNLIQGAGQITLNGSIVAGPVQGLNTIQYRDPSKVPVVGGSITPAAVTTLKGTLAPCGAIVTTTTSTSTSTSTSTTSTTSTTLPGATTTTSLPPVTTTSLPGTTTTTSTRVIATTTTSTVTTTTRVGATITPCTPRDCSDFDPCTVDVCVLEDGHCMHEPMMGVKSVTCHLEALEPMLDPAPKPVRRLRPKILTAHRLLNAAENAQVRTANRLFGRASKQLNAFIQGIEKGLARHRIEPDVGDPILELARGAQASLTPLRTGGQ